MNRHSFHTNEFVRVILNVAVALIVAGLLIYSATLLGQYAAKTTLLKGVENAVKETVSKTIKENLKEASPVAGIDLHLQRQGLQNLKKRGADSIISIGTSNNPAGKLGCTGTNSRTTDSGCDSK